MHIYVPLSIIAICWAIPAIGADAPDFNTFYNLYKTAGATNDITITSDITSTRLISVPGANTTTINGGGFDFAGSGFGGFIVSNGYDFSVSDVGAFSTDETNATIDKSFHNFINASEGGVISNLGGNVSIKNSAFSNNVSSLGGGALYQNNNGTINVADSVFQSNQATRGDGGVIYNEYETSATFNNSFFSNNSARDYGGVAFNDGTLNITASVFDSNTAQSGAALYNSNTMTLDNVRFINNTGTSDAGAIYTTGHMNLNNGIFENNSGVTGGAIGNYGITGDGLYSVIYNSDFSGNHATYGGAIYNWDDIYVIDSQFSGNSATDGGGAIFNLAELYLIANNDNISFTNNLSGGTSNAIQSSGTINMNAANNHQIIFNDKITGNGTIIINQPYIFDSENVPTGGEILLNADMSGFSGDITLHNGTLRVGDNGTLFNAANLQIMGGTLDIGTSGANAQSVIFANGATLALNIQNADTYGNLTANSFAIANGANLRVVLQPDAMGNESTMRVQLLRGADDINDNFMPNIYNNIYTFEKLGGGWYEISQTSDFSDVIMETGGTQNNLNTATAWRIEPPTSQIIEHAVYERINSLLQTDAIGYIHALTALAPSPAPLMQIMGTSYMSRTQSMIDDARNEYYIDNGKIWASGFGDVGGLNGTRQYADFDLYGFGGAIGAEYKLKDTTFGAAYTYQYDRIKSWARTIHAPTHGGAIYTKYTPGNIIWRAAGTMFYTKFNETKNVAGISIYNNPSVYTYGAWSDIGYRFLADKWNITPRGGIQYTMMQRSGAIDSAQQSAADTHLHFLTGYTDIQFTRRGMTIGDTEIIPEITIGGEYDLRTDADNTIVDINSARYNITAEKLPRWAATAGAHIRMIFNPITELRFGVDTQLRRGYNNFMAFVRGTLHF